MVIDLANICIIFFGLFLLLIVSYPLISLRDDTEQSWNAAVICVPLIVVGIVFVFCGILKLIVDNSLYLSKEFSNFLIYSRSFFNAKALKLIIQIIAGVVLIIMLINTIRTKISATINKKRVVINFDAIAEERFKTMEQYLKRDKSIDSLIREVQGYSGFLTLEYREKLQHYIAISVEQKRKLNQKRV